MSLAVYLFIPVFAIVVLTGTVSASQIHDDIGIVLGNTCKTMIKNNVTSDCPTYETLAAIYKDTTEPRFSGELMYIDGMYQRGPTKTDHFNFYQYEPAERRIWIDPPGDTINRIHIIKIEPSIPVYKLDGQSTLSYNSTGAELTVGHSRYMTPNCSESIISSKAWLLLLGDTMNIILKGCDLSVSQFDSRKTTFYNSTEFDIRTSYKYQLDKWYEEAKKVASSYKRH